jgi:pilus assembly protein CpaB
MKLPKLKVPAVSLGSNKNWVMLGAAIVVGVGAMYAANAYIGYRISSFEEAQKRGMELVKVVVAREDIPRGARVGAEGFALREIPRAYVHKDAVMPESFGNAEGQRMNFPLDRGKALLWAHLESGQTPTFSGKLAPGKRAITFPVNDVNSISGMLQPGDRIDLVVSLNQKGSNVTFPLLQDVKVLATGTQVSTIDDPATNLPTQRRFTTVTLQVDPGDANRIILAQDAGKLTAVLRNPDDGKINKMGRTTVSSLYNRATPTGGIQFIIGGQ